MLSIVDKNFSLVNVDEDPGWNYGSSPALRMHRIHAYPAKFPHFLVEKAINYARLNGGEPTLVADVFCGCGTTALESQLNGLSFWGCDINPVAVMIARVKSKTFNKASLERLSKSVVSDMNRMGAGRRWIVKNPRIRYWFDDRTIRELESLYGAIIVNSSGKNREFFLCAFSNILKGCSKWLTKSIKPQLDPNKIPNDVKSSFEKQVVSMLKAVEERNRISVPPNTVKILTSSILNYRAKHPFVDLIVTSPPYVTSYEYADLHQLSALWLGCTDDHTSLREGSIGSIQASKLQASRLKSIDEDAHGTYCELLETAPNRAKSVGKYFLDLNRAVQKTHGLLKNNGFATFIIGNTRYKGTEVDNAGFLIRSLLRSGFQNVAVTKRRISGKILTPYRNKKGRFSASDNGQQVYSHEFVIVGRKDI